MRSCSPSPSHCTSSVLRPRACGANSTANYRDQYAKKSSVLNFVLPCVTISAATWPSTEYWPARACTSENRTQARILNPSVLGWHHHQMGGAHQSRKIFMDHFISICYTSQAWSKSHVVWDPMTGSCFSLSLTFKSPWLKSLFTILNSSKLFLVPPPSFSKSPKKRSENSAPLLKFADLASTFLSF